MPNCLPTAALPITKAMAMNTKDSATNPSTAGSLTSAAIGATAMAVLLLTSTGCRKTATPAAAGIAAKSDQQAAPVQPPVVAQATIPAPAPPPQHTPPSHAGSQTGSADSPSAPAAHAPSQTAQLQSPPNPAVQPHPGPQAQAEQTAGYQGNPPPLAALVQPAIPFQAAAPLPVAPVVVMVAPGTLVPVRIAESLSSQHSHANDEFHGWLASDLIVNGMVAVPRGASVVGRVVEAKDATHFKGSSELSLELTQVTDDGHRSTLVTDAYTQEGLGRGKNTAERTGGGAAIGGVIGAIAGGGKGAAIGVITGAAYGAGSESLSRGEQVNILPETIVNFRLQNPLMISTSHKVDPSAAGDTPTLQPR
jgi:hypothetical protein